jgi:ATP-binding cassette subfamily B protein RaxB
MILHLATAAGPLQVGVTSRRPAAAPARDAGLTGFGAEGAKSAEAAQGHDECSDDGRKGDYYKHVGKDDHSKAGKDDYSKHGWKDAKNDDGEAHKDDCQPQKDYFEPSDDCGKGDTYRNPGEALAKIDFSRR